MKRTMLLITLVGLSLTGCVEPVRQDVEALKQGQDTLRKDMDDIKKLLQAREEPPTPPVAQALDTVLEIGDAPLKGNQDAKLTLMEFSDYQCPFCKRYAEATLPQIDQEYITTGKLRYVFHNFPLPMHKQAQKAAEAAHCAGDQGKYWEMHDKLFAKQERLAAKELAGYARSIGLKAGPFKKCLDSGKYAEKVKSDITEGKKLGVTATPTLMLGVSNGNKVKDVKVIRGAYPFPIFKQEIDKLLKGNDERAEKN